MEEITIKELIERFSKKQEGGLFPCLRCGRMAMDTKPTRNAQSRRASVYICDSCGIGEPLEDVVSNFLVR